MRSAISLQKHKLPGRDFPADHDRHHISTSGTAKNGASSLRLKSMGNRVDRCRYAAHFDSMFRTVSANAILQLSAILLRQTDCDSITVHVRDFDVQPHRSRLCGFYAAAAALSICNDVDPSGNRYDVDSLASCVSVAVANKCPDVIVPRQNVGASDLSVVVRPKLHCVCHSASTDRDMVQCSQCMYRYHSVCLAVTDTTDHTWLGPCCVSSSSAIRARRAELQPHEHSTFNATTRNFT